MPANGPSTTPPPASPAPLQEPSIILDATFFWDKYKLPILGVVLLLVLGFVGSALYEHSKEEKAVAASAQMASAKTADDYQRVIDTYPGTMPAADAYLLLARTQREKKDFTASERTLRAFLEKYPDHPLAGGALLAIAGDLDAVGQRDNALAAYRNVAEKYSSSYAAPLALMDQATLLRGENKIEEARRAYENLIASYPLSNVAREANEEMRYLHVTGSPSPSPAAPPAKAAGK